MDLQGFTWQNGGQCNPDIFMGLTEFEQKIAKHFERVEIRGKRSRMVPVHLTPGMIAAMELLVKNRNQCQVHTGHLFVHPLQRLRLLSYVCKIVWCTVPRGTHFNKTTEASQHFIHSA